MRTLEKGQDKIKKICAVLREEALDPAQKEAEKIIEKAKLEAEKIIAEAEKTQAEMHHQAKEAINQENNIFQASLEQASKQALETLRQHIESKFFNDHLSSVIEKGACDPQLIANFFNVLVMSLEKDGIAADLSGSVSKNIQPRQINELLLADVLKSLRDNSVILGNFNSGIQLKLNNKRLTLDISDSALKELLATYVVRKDFRKMIFETDL